MGKKKLGGCGENNTAAKLTEADVVRMRAEHFNDGVQISTLAAAYGVKRSTADNAIKGYTWRQVPMPEGYELPAKTRRGGAWYRKNRLKREPDQATLAKPPGLS